MSEQYKQFGEYYKVYSDGRIYSGKFKRFLKPRMNNKGYLRIYYKKKDYMIHRLVAELFIPNPENKPDVDHIDGNKQNNDVSNLRWVSRKENMNNPNTYFKTYFNTHNKKIQDNEGNFYNSVREASKILNIPESTIGDSLKRKTPLRNGLYFKEV